MDDAGVYKVSQDLAMVQSVDFFTPMVDDPYLFGQIAAANSLSDIYAMGAQPKTAMNLVGFPVNSMDLSVLEAILAGGADKLLEARTVMIGGHTVEDKEPKYGLSVTGLVHPDRVLANRGARPGDLLILTKPLGSGIISTAIKADEASPAQIDQVIDVMRTLNDKALLACQGLEVHASTDITGFGLLGHAHEMVADGRVSFKLKAADIPLLAGTQELARMGLIPGGAHRNRSYLEGAVRLGQGLDRALADCLFDPQTSGGLLLALAEKEAQAYLSAFSSLGGQAKIIGQVADDHPGLVLVD